MRHQQHMSWLTRLHQVDTSCHLQWQNQDELEGSVGLLALVFRLLLLSVAGQHQGGCRGGQAPPAGWRRRMFQCNHLIVDTHRQVHARPALPCRTAPRRPSWRSAPPAAWRRRRRGTRRQRRSAACCCCAWRRRQMGATRQVGMPTCQDNQGLVIAPGSVGSPNHLRCVSLQRALSRSVRYTNPRT